MVTNTWLASLKAHLGLVPAKRGRRRPRSKPVLEQLESRLAPSATITVNSALDTNVRDSVLTLREAILVNNRTLAVSALSATEQAQVSGTPTGTDRDTIAFNIPGTGVQTISPTSALPLVTDSVVIDGYTQPGTSPNTLATGNNAVLRIELDGSNTGLDANGLDLLGGNSVVRGMVINRFFQVGLGTISSGYGIRLTTNGGNLIEGNFLGTDAAGTTPLGNTNGGVGIRQSPNNLIGGAAPAARNLISGNGAEFSGAGFGIDVTFATGNRVQGNYIGSDRAGTARLGNYGTGVRVLSAGGTVIGGTGPGERNVISGNGSGGISISGSSGSQVQGNLIGTDVTGTMNLGNVGSGVEVGSSNNVTVGGASGGGNTIAFNDADGVTLFSGTGNAILTNSIHSNTGLGINLGFDGRTLNDTNDADSGANNLQNFPVLTSANSSGGSTTVQGALNSQPAVITYTLQFFANTSADPSGFGEGRMSLGSATVTTNSSGTANFTVTLPVAVPVGQSVTTTATDPNGNTSEFSLNQAVVSANSAPVAGANAYSVNEDATLTVAAPGVLANDSDPDGNPLTAVQVSGPTNGTLTLNADGSFSYAPAANFFGTASFTYKVSDGTNFSNTVTVSITVNAVNDAPSFTKGADRTVAEDAGPQTVAGWATAPSANEAGQTLQFLVSNDGNALFWQQPAVAADGTLTFTPAPDAHGTATVSVLLKDNGGTANGGQDTGVVQTFTVTITPVNDAPVAEGDARTTDEDVPVSVAVLVNDFDADDAAHAGAPFFTFNSQTVASDATGPLLISSGGTDFFAFRNLDSGAGTATAIGGFTSLAGLPPGALTFTLGDLELVDFVGTTATATEVYAEGDGNVVPFQIFRGGALAASGSDLVVTIVTDRDPSSATFGQARGFVQVTLTGVAGDPFFEEVLALTGGTGRLRATLGSFTPTTFADPETFVSTGAFVLNRLIVSSVTDGANGTVAITPGGAAVTYTPNADFHGTDTFTYTVSDPDGGTATATVSMTVRSVNDAPLASDESYSLNEDHGLAVAAPGVLANDSDADGDPLSFGGLMTAPQHGTVLFQADGSFTYTPAQDFVGTDSFTYRANDASLTPSNVATVTLTVRPVNDAPGFTAGPDVFVFEDGGPVTMSGWATGLSAGPADESAQQLSFQVSAADPALFAVQPTVAPDGTLTFTPAADASGSTLVTVTLRDDGGTDNSGTDTSTPRTFSILIVPANDAPTANDLAVAGPEDGFIAGQVGGGDVDGDPLSVALATSPLHGTVNLSANGFFLYEPNADFNGTDTFTFTASDGQLASVPATVTITVIPANDPPTAVADHFATPFNTSLNVPVAGSVLSNDIDIDGDAVQFAGLTANPTHGSILFQADGSFSYTPHAGFVGTDTFSYLISDGQSVSAPAAVTITVEAPPQSSRIQGLVWEDFNDNGAVDFGETAIANVMIRLTGRDDLGAVVDRTLLTDAQGIFEFLNLRPSDQDGYTLTETQPAGYVDGQEAVGTVNGLPSGTASDNGFAGIVLSAAGPDGVNYNFGERPAAGGTVHRGQTATIGFWQNKNGQNLIRALNGGPGSTQLGNWLAQTLPNLYGPTAGANSLAGKTNTQVAAQFVSLFKQTSAIDGPPKLGAQVLATAFAVYVTNEALAGQTAVAYGFQVSAGGLGAATFDVGSANRAAFGLSPTAGTVMTVLDLLLATDALSRDGVLYDPDGSGTVSGVEQSLRGMANSVFAAINQQGDI